jgi:Amt family ammonium transporter
VARHAHPQARLHGVPDDVRDHHPALITGALAGRLKFTAWIAICLSWSLIIYPVIAHWVFDPAGWIYRLGGRDFAGGAVVHLSAGVAAAVLVLLLRPRSAPDAAAYQPSSVPVIVLGAGILWFGWFGFNAGSALAANQVAASAFTVTQIAAATGFLVWAVIEHSRTGKTTLVGLTTGAVAGLATITPAAGYVGPLPPSRPAPPAPPPPAISPVLRPRRSSASMMPSA